MEEPDYSSDEGDFDEFDEDEGDEVNGKDEASKYKAKIGIFPPHKSSSSSLSLLIPHSYLPLGILSSLLFPLLYFPLLSFLPFSSTQFLHFFWFYYSYLYFNNYSIDAKNKADSLLYDSKEDEKNSNWVEKNMKSRSNLSSFLSPPPYF
jgi:hypothetical protein